MDQLNPFIPVLFVLPLLVFYLWMFQDMLQNNNLPGLMTRDAKTDWTIVFVLLNVFAAVFYYAQIYRNKR